MTASAQDPTKTRGIVSSIWSLMAPAKFPPRPPNHTAIAYSPRDGRARHAIAPHADIYTPDTPGPHPSVVLVHGGGFLLGSRAMKPMRYLGGALVAAGFQVVSISYRCLFRGGRLQEATSDINAALNWWRTVGPERFNADPSRTAMVGLSAGATLTLLAAAQAPDLHRVVAFYPVTEFAELRGRGTGLLNRLLHRSTDPDDWRAASPASAPAITAPLFLLHGTADTIVPLRHSEAYAETRQAAGLPTEFRTYADLPHGWVNHADWPQTQQSVADVIAFLRA